MAWVCELTGKKPMAGNNVSHAHNKTKRRFMPNLCRVTLSSEKLKERVPMRISAHALRTVDHCGGLDAYLLKTPNTKLSPRMRRTKKRILALS